MTYTQQQTIEALVNMYGFFKTSQMVRRMYEDGIITLKQYQAIFRKLRNMQFRQLSIISSFLFNL